MNLKFSLLIFVFLTIASDAFGVVIKLHNQTGENLAKVTYEADYENVGSNAIPIKDIQSFVLAKDENKELSIKNNVDNITLSSIKFIINGQEIPIDLKNLNESSTRGFNNYSIVKKYSILQSF